MQTVDIHTHLLNPQVRFHRLYDLFAIAFFAKSLGQNAKELFKTPFASFVAGLAQCVKGSNYVKKVCLLPVDSRLNENGVEIHRDPTVCSHTQDVLDVCQRYPELFIPFLSVNPLRKNALELLDQYAEAGCKGAKALQNYWGVDLRDEKWTPYYEKLKDKGIPLIVHLGSEFAVPSFKRHERLDMLDLPLQIGLTVIAAHAGTGRLTHPFQAWKNLSTNPRDFEQDYFKLLEMLDAYPNLYADISAMLSPFRARVLRHLANQKHIHHKILYGSDYPVPFTTRLNTFDLTFRQKSEISKIANPFDRYIAVMLNYFPPNSPIYTNYQTVLKI
jgi:predicted TIM-barrel fold metal-dependent hydrolase